MAIVISGVNNNDKITASDGTIDLLSGVNYAGIITAPGFTASNNLTAANINVGSNIQLGNAGVVTATTFTGNLTGNVNATSNLLLQIGGSEKFRVASSGQLGIGGANYGTSGQVLTSGGSGSAATWSTITGTTISGNGDNKLITGSGTANTLIAEEDLTFDGTSLKLPDHKNMYFGTGNDLRIWHDANNSYSQISSGQMNFYIDGLTTYMRSGNGSSGVENAIVMNNNSSVDLYHSGTKKFETTSTGVKVSGGTVELQSDMVRVGNRTTAQINAGVSTSTGAVTVDTTMNKLRYYANNEWITVTQDFNNGSTQATAARSAKELLDNGVTSSGVYWLDMHGAYSSGNGKRHYCLQDTSYDGGGWTMLWCMNHGNNFASGHNFSYALNVGSPTSVSDFTAGNWGYDRRNTFTPAANDQFLIRRSDNNDWRRFVVTTWSPTHNSVSDGWSCTQSTDGVNRNHPYYAYGQMYDTSGNAVSGMVHFNGCAVGGNCATGGGDSDGFGDHINWSSGYSPYNCWGGSFNGHGNGGSPLYWGQTALSQGGSLYLQMFYRRAGTQ